MNDKMAVFTYRQKNKAKELLKDNNIQYSALFIDSVQFFDEQDAKKAQALFNKYLPANSGITDKLINTNAVLMRAKRSELLKNSL